MESQHRKITYRMKRRGMYWSLSGANTMAKMIILERSEQFRDLFFGSWRKDFECYKVLRTNVGRLIKKPNPNEPRFRKYREGYIKGKWNSRVF